MSPTASPAKGTFLFMSSATARAADSHEWIDDLAAGEWDETRNSGAAVTSATESDRPERASAARGFDVDEARRRIESLKHLQEDLEKDPDF